MGVSPRWVRKLLKRITDEMPFIGCKAKCTLLADGVDLATVSERLGHSSVRVTAEIYSHAIRGRDQDAARRWDKLMGPNGGSREETSGVN